MKKLFVLLFVFPLLFSCGDDSPKNEKDGSKITGLDYRVIMDKNPESREVQKFFEKIKLSINSKHIDIDIKKGRISEITFRKTCPEKYMPFELSRKMNKSMVIELLGEPDFIQNRSILYNDLQLVVQFEIGGDLIDDVGIIPRRLIDKLLSENRDETINENNLSVEIREFDDPLFCQCMQYETDLLNAVIDGPHDAMKNESDFEAKNIELDKRCESFERKIEKRAKKEEEKGEVYLNKMIQSFEKRQKECACYDELIEARNRQKKAIENDLKEKSKEIQELNDLDGINFRLNISNKRASPAGRISFIADYKIQLTDGSSIIAFFEDAGEGYISNEKDFVSILTDAGSERTYKHIEDRNGIVRVSLNFFFDGMENEIWRKTYKKNNMNDWIQISCEGDCEY